MGSLDDGAYLHIIGYVQSVDPKTETAEVDAVKVWQAGEVDIKEWEGVVRARDEVQGMMDMVVKEGERRGEDVWRGEGR